MQVDQLCRQLADGKALHDQEDAHYQLMLARQAADAIRTKAAAAASGALSTSVDLPAGVGMAATPVGGQGTMPQRRHQEQQRRQQEQQRPLETGALRHGGRRSECPGLRGTASGWNLCRPSSGGPVKAAAGSSSGLAAPGVPEQPMRSWRP